MTQSALHQTLTTSLLARTDFRQQIQDSLDELLCSPALAAARSCAARLSAMHQRDGETDFAARLLLEEDALRQIIEQIRLSEILDWREAEHRAHTAAHREQVAQPRLTIVGSDVELTALDEYYRREALRLSAIEQMLIDTADRAECFIENARHWRQTAACAHRSSQIREISTHLALATAHEWLQASAALIADAYLGQASEHLAEIDSPDLRLPNTAKHLTE